METRSYAFWTGLFVIGVAALIGATIFWLSQRDRQPTVPYIVETKESVLGLVPESQVLYRGVVVGTVADIEFDPENFENILIHLEVQRRVPVGEKTFANLRLRGITGMLDLELNDDGDAGERLDTDRSNPARIQVRPSFLNRLSSSGKELMTELMEVINKVDRAVSEDNLADLDAILGNLNRASERLLVLEDEISGAISGVPLLVDDSRAAVQHLDATIGDVQKTLQNDVQKTLQNIDRSLAAFDRAANTVNDLGGAAQGVTVRLSNETLPEFNTLLEELTRTSESLREITLLIRDNPQSLLLGNPRPAPGPGEEGYRRPQP